MTTNGLGRLVFLCAISDILSYYVNITVVDEENMCHFVLCFSQPPVVTAFGVIFSVQNRFYKRASNFSCYFFFTAAGRMQAFGVICFFFVNCTQANLRRASFILPLVECECKMVSLRLVYFFVCSSLQ